MRSVRSGIVLPCKIYRPWRAASPADQTLDRRRVIRRRLPMLRSDQLELAEMLRSRNIQVTFLVREKSYMDYLFPEEESAMIGQHIGQFGVKFLYGTELTSINTDDSGHVSSVITSKGEQIEADFVGLTAGVHPNTAFAIACGIEIGRGVLVDRAFQTSRPGVFAIGDCAEFRTPLSDGRTIEQLWYSGRRQGQALGRLLSGQSVQYKQGVFFNSAKFFELEYQTYGRVDAMPPQGFTSELAVRESRQQLIRVQYEQSTGTVVGLNVLGMRLRHEVCDRWISEKVTVAQVVGELKDAGFDPEFFSRLTLSAENLSEAK